MLSAMYITASIWVNDDEEGLWGGLLASVNPWERVFYAGFDGRRKKRVVVKVLGE